MDKLVEEKLRLFPEAHDVLTRQEMRDAKGNWRSLIDQQTNALAELRESAAIAQKRVNELEAELAEKPTDPAELIGIAKAISFYADPENWHGVYMVGRGPMADDWSDVEDPQYPDGKPGKRAREAIDTYLESRAALHQAQSTDNDLG